MKPKKSLGQNFLKSGKALGDIVRAGNVSADDIVLEIGPGKGALTEKLLETGAKVFAVEKDCDLIPLLTEKFASYIASGKLKLIEADILDYDPTYDLRLTTSSSYKLVGNIPYYITGAIIRKFLESDFQPTLAVFLVQKEVAERIVARDKKESILSLSVKAYGEPKLVAKVPKRYFTPEPKVDSAVLLIDNINKKNFRNITEQDFFMIVKSAFGQKRKTMLKNLSNAGISKENLAFMAKDMVIDPKIRAEDLSMEQFLALTHALFPNKQ